MIIHNITLTILEVVELSRLLGFVNITRHVIIVTNKRFVFKEVSKMSDLDKPLEELRAKIKTDFKNANILHIINLILEQTKESPEF